MDRLRNDAQLNICTSIFSSEVLVILLFLTRSFKEFEEISGSTKTFRFFSTNYHLTKGIPFVFHRLFHPSKEQQLGKKFPSSLTTTSFFEEVYFRHRNVFI